ncbi:unnamed protein product [Lactuca saligna]|uniref:PGG domain-containing protein n=1 Tax=Lactuca saligna TaxID=75948 RepID=A0AA35Y2B7_LACSI|nr:unnamed protein product [Lactuca saligna]
MASSSNPSSSSSSSAPQNQDSHAFNANVSNFVSVKLSSEGNYHLWEKQMGCLLKSYNLYDIVCDQSTPDLINTPPNSLVMGWIFSTISEELLNTVFNLESAKKVWDKLKSIYDPTITHSTKETETETGQDERAVPTDTRPSMEEKILKIKDEVKDKVAKYKRTIKEAVALNPAETETETGQHESAVPTDTRTLIEEMLKLKEEVKGKVTRYEKKIKQALGGLFIERKPKVQMKEDEKTKRNKMLCSAIVEGRWDDVKSMIDKQKVEITEAIDSDKNTILHLLVGIGHMNSSVHEVLSKINKAELHEMRNKNGSTALHIAAIVGNTEGAKLLIKRNKNLLATEDNKHETPLHKAFENMHLDTVEYLLKATKKDGKTKENLIDVKEGSNLLANAISAKQYDLAKELIQKYPQFAVEGDEVLMAIAKTFPTGLDYWETLIYPIPDHTFEWMVERARILFYTLVWFHRIPMKIIQDIPNNMIWSILKLVQFTIIMVPLCVLSWICRLIILLFITMVYFPFFMFYFFMWKILITECKYIEDIEKKHREPQEAKTVLKLVCDEIENSGKPHDPRRYYARPVHEAARQDAYEVVDEILMRCPEAIRYKDKSGYDIIQIAVIHRSEHIYELIKILGERRNVYRTIEDSSQNNMLHLVGRLAPTHKLKLRTGAALQLQRELQWREVVKKMVSPAYITKENIFNETPDMVFTKEHKHLVKEGEQWMKTVAESCSITAALIATIVFAAAITVPGGSNQDTGIPVFTENVAFKIFAVADAISLFASSTALLMFQSILTGRFSEQDFRITLPNRLILGLCSLMISTTAMMVAFSATLFFVFCHGKRWMLAPICVLAFLPIVSFAIFQIPLMVELYRSICGYYEYIFEKVRNKNKPRSLPYGIRLFFD